MSLSLGDHSVAVMKDALYTWGTNSHGQLGHPRRKDSDLSAPRRVEHFDGRQVESAWIGSTFTVVKCKYEGLFFLGKLVHEVSHSPVKLDFFTRREVSMCSSSTFADHLLIVCPGEGIYGCGANVMGELGIPERNVSPLRPCRAAGLEPNDVVSAIGSGLNLSAAIVNGRVRTCGYGLAAGHGTHAREVPHFTTVATLADIEAVALAVGRRTVVVVTQRGLYAFGVAIGAHHTYRLQPEHIVCPPNATAVAYGAAHGLLLSDDGELYVFGEGTSGELGLGGGKGGRGSVGAITEGLGAHARTEVRVIDTKCPFFRGHNAVAISCGARMSGVVSGNSVFTFGDPFGGRLGVGALESNTDCDATALPRLVSFADAAHDALRVGLGGAALGAPAAANSDILAAAIAAGRGAGAAVSVDGVLTALRSGLASGGLQLPLGADTAAVGVLLRELSAALAGAPTTASGLGADAESDGTDPDDDAPRAAVGASPTGPVVPAIEAPPAAASAVDAADAPASDNATAPAAAAAAPVSVAVEDDAAGAASPGVDAADAAGAADAAPRASVATTAVPSSDEPSAAAPAGAPAILAPAGSEVAATPQPPEAPAAPPATPAETSANADAPPPAAPPAPPGTVPAVPADAVAPSAAVPGVAARGRPPASASGSRRASGQQPAIASADPQPAAAAVAEAPADSATDAPLAAATGGSDDDEGPTAAPAAAPAAVDTTEAASGGDVHDAAPAARAKTGERAAAAAAAAKAALSAAVAALSESSGDDSDSDEEEEDEEEEEDDDDDDGPPSKASAAAPAATPTLTQPLTAALAAPPPAPVSSIAARAAAASAARAAAAAARAAAAGDVVPDASPAAANRFDGILGGLGGRGGRGRGLLAEAKARAAAGDK